MFLKINNASTSLYIKYFIKEVIKKLNVKREVITLKKIPNIINQFVLINGCSY